MNIQKNKKKNTKNECQSLYLKDTKINLLLHFSSSLGFFFLLFFDIYTTCCNTNTSTNTKTFLCYLYLHLHLYLVLFTSFFLFFLNTSI